MPAFRKRGFTLAELLVVVVVVGIIAAAVVPMLSSTEPQRLAVAAEETANVLRFALSEANRTGGYVLVDGKTASGHLSLYYSNASGDIPPVAGTAAVNDPLTKRVLDLDVGANPFSAGVTLTPRFMAGGTARPRLLIGPGLSQMRGWDSASEGPLQANSGIQLSLGGRVATVAISETTGLVTLP